MVCKNCGQNLDDNSLFCGNCGVKVEEKKLENNISENNISNNNSSNNNLKNLLIILLVCVVIGGIAVIGYTLLFSNKSGADVIERALNNMVKLDSYKMDMSLDLKATADDEEVSVNLSVNSDIDVKNKLASITANAKANGVSFEIPAYVDVNNKSAYIKIPTDNSWYKLSFSDYLEDDISDSNTYYVIEDYLRNDDFIETISNSNGVKQYRLHFTKDALNKLSEDSSNDFDASLLSEVGLEDGFDIDIFVNTKKNYISKIVFDFSGKTFEDVTFDEFVFKVEFSNVNSVDTITIPSDALDAEELDLSDIMGGEVLPDYDYDYDNEEYVEDYKLTYDNLVVSYNLPSGYEASFVNSKDFKIYRKNGMRVIMTIEYDTKDSYFEYVLSEKEDAEEDSTNVTLSDIKELKYNDKTFNYQVLQYTDTYGNKNYIAYLCYELDSKYVYSVEYEDEDFTGVVNEDTMKDFLDITVSKK